MPNAAKVRRWARIATRALAIVGVVLVFGAAGVYAGVRGPTGTLNEFLSDLKSRHDAQAWTHLCAADRRALPEREFVAAWNRQRAKYGAVIDQIDAFTFEPIGNVRHFHYRLSFVADKVQANTYPVDLVREGGQWKVCNFFSLSRNPDQPGLLSGFENWT